MCKNPICNKLPFGFRLIRNQATNCEVSSFISGVLGTRPSGSISSLRGFSEIFPEEVTSRLSPTCWWESSRHAIPDRKSRRDGNVGCWGVADPHSWLRVCEVGSRPWRWKWDQGHLDQDGSCVRLRLLLLLLKFLWLWITGINSGKHELKGIFWKDSRVAQGTKEKAKHPGLWEDEQLEQLLACQQRNLRTFLCSVIPLVDLFYLLRISLYSEFIFSRNRIWLA